MKAFMLKNKKILLPSLIFIIIGGFAVFLYFDRDSTDLPVPPASAVYLDESQPIEVRVADLLSYMTLEEKIGQMTLVEKNSINEQDDISKYYLGGILSGAGAKPAENTVEGWAEMIDGYQAAAKQSRLSIPLLYGADAVHGHALVPTATVFPHAIGFGASGNADLVEKVANATAEEMFATGVNWNFYPNLDLPKDVRWGRVYEAFSDDSKLASDLGASYVEGLQTNDDLNEHIFVLASVKHFLGLGSMEWNTSKNVNYTIDQGITAADETLLRTVYLPPFEKAIDAGALNIMIGLNTWGETTMILQKEILTDLLKEELGFKGFLVSDWYGAYEGRGNTFSASVQTVNAGVDMIMLPYDYEKFARHLKLANRFGLISDERIDDAVGRILYAKFAMGLFDDDRSTVDRMEFPNADHRALAREAVNQSLVLLKNEGGVLPLSPNTSHIRVGGSAADNVGAQMGAWTIEWQGADGDLTDDAISILEGIRSRVSRTTMVEYDKNGDFESSSKKAPIGIAIVGEKPYAEGWGDKEYPVLSDEDLLTIKNMQDSCEKVVVIIVSGRPLLITDEVDSFDALVAAWLPGSEGQGVSDVLFGDKPFVGKLPLPWPKYSEQLPINAVGETADGTPVLFPRYFGLR